jgi:SAM-dependent methyltransferase
MSEGKPKSWVEQVRGDEWSSWPARRQSAFLRLAVEYWQQRGSPYYELTDSQIARELELLVGSDPSRILRGNTLMSSTTGLRLANYFHPQMWHVRCTRYLSPVETFSDPRRLRVAIAKAMRIWPDRYGARGTTLRRMLRSFSNTVGVSNFRPTAARAIMHRFSPAGGCVLDFSAGYGGRLLAALTLDRSYVGIDVSQAQTSGLRAMVARCAPKLGYRREARIIRGSAEETLHEIPRRSVDLVFSSPPYFDREKYGTEPDQSFIRYPTLEGWIEGFLNVIMLESARILRQGGVLVLNVGNIPERLPAFVRQWRHPSLHLQRTMRLQLAKLPYKRTNALDAFKTEPVFVFEKVR